MGSVYDGLPDMLSILRTALEVAYAMQYLHSKHVLHGMHAPIHARSEYFNAAVCMQKIYTLCTHNTCHQPRPLYSFHPFFCRNVCPRLGRRNSIMFHGSGVQKIQGDVKE